MIQVLTVACMRRWAVVAPIGPGPCSLALPVEEEIVQSVPIAVDQLEQQREAWRQGETSRPCWSSGVG